MAKLVVGRFENINGVERALAVLPRAGFAREEFGTFYVAPPGQHQLYPIGGDAHSDQGARDAGAGAAAGVAMGGATGLAVGALAAAVLPFIPIAGVLATAGIGAYAGSLMGALSKTRDADESEATPEHPVEQPGGPRVAVRVDRPGTESLAIEVLERVGAKEIAHGEGEWHARLWQDYDPRVPPERVDETTQTS
jgi:hypothetical protein